MTVKEIKKEQKELEDKINNLLIEFSVKTEVKLKGVKCSSFYDTSKIRGQHIVNIDLRNPFE